MFILGLGKVTENVDYKLLELLVKFMANVSQRTDVITKNIWLWRSNNDAHKMLLQAVVCSFA